MGLYAAGKTSAIASIKAAINSRITTLSDGSLSLDWVGLQQWLEEQGNLVVAQDVATANIAAAKGVLGGVNTDPDSRALAATISRDNWQSRPDWPTAASVTSGLGFVHSVSSAISRMYQATTAIESHYADAYGKIEDVINTSADEQALAAKLPATTERIVNTVYYIYTYVTDWGEESAPSPVSDGLDVDQNDTVSISIGPAPAGRNITKWRFYRSSVGSSLAAFQFLAEGVITTLTGVNDPKSLLGEVCPTLTWLKPPSNLRGLTGMQNGVMAGFYDNVVCFCEPYVPYAWPVEYQLTAAYPIVAMAAFGQTLVVAHHGGIDYITGADSASMSAQKDVSKQTCVSARSMHPVEGGVVFASPDGLCLANSQGVQVLTKALFSREDWQALSPTTMVGSYHEHTYYFSVPSKSGFYALHLETGKLTTIPGTASAFYQDTLTDTLYAADGTNIIALFSGTTRRTGKWRSKVFVMPNQTSFAWLTVESDFAHPVTVRWYGDGVLRHEATLTSRSPVRLPPGRHLEHEIEVESKANWNALTIASSTQELQGV